MRVDIIKKGKWLFIGEKYLVYLGLVGEMINMTLKMNCIVGCKLKEYWYVMKW